MIAIHDKRIPSGYIDDLQKQLPATVFIPFGGIRGAVYGSISCHPDIFFFQLDERTVIHAPGLAGGQLLPLKEAGVELIAGEGDPGGRYPETARYNACRVGNIIFHDLSRTDPVIKNEAENRGLRLVHVSQGYTRCSVLIVGNNAIITPDKNIAGAARMEGMDVLTVSPGEIDLPGERYGFIGGASGITPDGHVVLLGDPDLHAMGEEISEFVRDNAPHGVKLYEKMLYDAGTVLFLLS